MANYFYGENAIEWLRGQNTMVVSLSDPELIKEVVAMSKEDKDVEIIGKDKHTLCAKVPRSYLRLKKPAVRKKTKKRSA